MDVLNQVSAAMKQQWSFATNRLIVVGVVVVVVVVVFFVSFKGGALIFKHFKLLAKDIFFCWFAAVSQRLRCPFCRFHGCRQKTRSWRFSDDAAQRLARGVCLVCLSVCQVGSAVGIITV